MDLWPFGRQLVEANGFGLTGLFELGLELGAAIDLDGLDRDRHLGMTFSSSQNAIISGYCPLISGS